MYLILGLTLTFLVLMRVDLVLGEDECDPSEQIETLEQKGFNRKGITLEIRGKIIELLPEKSEESANGI